MKVECAWNGVGENWEWNQECGNGIGVRLRNVELKDLSQLSIRAKPKICRLQLLRTVDTLRNKYKNSQDFTLRFRKNKVAQIELDQEGCIEIKFKYFPKNYLKSDSCKFAQYLAPIVKYNYNDQIMFFSRLHISDLLTLCVTQVLYHTVRPNSSSINLFSWTTKA